MIVWLQKGSAPQQAGAAWRFGRLCAHSTPAECSGELPLLIEVRAQTDIAAGVNAYAWYMAPGRVLDAPLLEALGKNGCETLVPVNGLGERGLAMLRDALPYERLILTYHVGDADDSVFLEQLAWLSRQPEKFAVASECANKLCIAALAGADALLAPAPDNLDMNALNRVLKARQPNAARPASAEEVDRLAGHELCLTVTRPMRAGDQIAEDDLAVAVTEFRGLAPTMRGTAVGRTLRYPIEPGEAIHFGHLA